MLSPSTAARDNIQKLVLYEKHGVREYWLVHPVDRLATVYLLGEDGRYGRPSLFGAEDRIETVALPGLVIDLARVFEPPSPPNTTTAPPPTTPRD